MGGRSPRDRARPRRPARATGRAARRDEAVPTPQRLLKPLRQMNALMKDMRTVRAWSIRMEEEMAKALALLDDRPPSEKNALLGVRRCAEGSPGGAAGGVVYSIAF